MNIVRIGTSLKVASLTLDLPVTVAIFCRKKTVLLFEGFRGAVLVKVHLDRMCGVLCLHFTFDMHV